MTSSPSAPRLAKHLGMTERIFAGPRTRKLLATV
ncbi:MAG: hypothetical protein K0S70_1465, partial [Microbacterium sp.]|nr:hypothetical protein [Microbacterium sp.]